MSDIDTIIEQHTRHGYCTVEQLRQATEGLSGDTWLVVNGVGNLSVVRDAPDTDCDCGKPHFDIIGYIELGPFDLADSVPEAVLELYDDEPPEAKP